MSLSSLFQIIIVILKKTKNKINKRGREQLGAGRGQLGATKRGHGAAPCQKRLGRTLCCVLLIVEYKVIQPSEL